MYSLKTTAKVIGVYFSLGNTPSKDPELSCSKAICDLFSNARYSALVSIYSLSEKAIIDSMIAAHQRGVNVVVVADYLQSKGKNMNQYLGKLEKAGIPVFTAKKQKACMHNKVGIFDSIIVATGSYNWTSNGTRKNDENLVLMEGKELATIYEKYVFERVITNETAKRIKLYNII
jgi:phosphatidylserine/phosphatidylglycerophosphate/cardiolipin synthase-like enzyme